MSNLPIIKIENLSKKFVIHRDKSLKSRVVNRRQSVKHREEFYALRDVSLSVSVGESLGLVGPNGSGKSTLLKTIGGIILPDEGTVQVRGRTAALLELGAGFHPDLTGRENVYLNAAIMGRTQAETDRDFAAIVDFSGIEDFIDTQVKFYSSGMYVRLAFAVAVHSDPDILLVDEVLAVGDEPFQRKCMERIRQFQREGRSIILVSHSAEQVVEVCNRAIVLEHGQVVIDDEPATAMSQLRAHYEARIRADIERGSGGAPAGTGGDVRILSVATTTAGTTSDGEGTVRFTSGSDLTVSASIVTTDELRDYLLTASIETATGQVVLATNTELQSQDLPPVRGEARLHLSFPTLPLAPGDYALNLGVRSKVGYDITIAPRVVRLQVEADLPIGGFVYANPKFDLS